MDDICSLFHLHCSAGANMKEFADELRASREAKHISLTDVSSTTKIQLKYLRAMEEGDFSFLPQPYIRAFLRDYAKAIHTNPEEILGQYAAAIEARAKAVELRQPEHEASEAPFLEHDLSVHPTGGSRSVRLSFRELLSNGPSRRKFLPTVALFLLIAGVVLVASITRNNKKESISETPFEQVIKERERASSGQLDSSMPNRGAFSVAMVPSDSLVLEGKTSQEVWMRLLIDDGPPKEYLFVPKAVRTWKAKEKFQLSLGNAGGISFKLNGEDLGTLGKSGAVIRNALITRKGVQK